MLRTYKSKKDTGGGVDRKDLIQNLDEKSSAFDAFYIQNIKQTKRELSCVGSSKPYGVTSNRVRKRKYVRRIVKEVETCPRESLSKSAYLTPDKSLRVNKPLDPFDMLLNSSPVCPSDDIGKKTETVTNKVDLFDGLMTKKESKTYVRKKRVKAKKYNYSSSETDSDKENSDGQTKIAKDTSDIKTHELLVEPDCNHSPKHFDKSINKILNNVSLLNRMQLKNSFNESMVTPFKYRNRLTHNILSPQTSPLCSTPFNIKYRGESIYKLSPILKTSVKTKKVTAGDCKSSIKLMTKNKVSSKLSDDYQSPINNITAKSVTETNIDSTVIKPKIENEQKCLLDVVSQTEEKCSQDNGVIVEISSFQTTETEPFMGFSNPTIEEIASDKVETTEETIEYENNKTEIEAYVDRSIFVENHVNIFNDPSIASSEMAISQLGRSKNDSIIGANGEIEHVFNINETNLNKDHIIIEESNEDISKKASNMENDDNSYSSLENSDIAIDDFSRDKDESNDIANGNTEHVLNDNCLKANEILCSIEKSNENNMSNISTDLNDDSSFETSETDNESLYNTCSSDRSSVESRFALREPIVQIERMNDSMFLKYYEKMHCYESDDETESDVVNSTNVDSEEFASLNNSTKSSKDKSIDDEDNSSENEPDFSDGASSNEDVLDLSNNYEEKCISFVTTRRRNDVTNSSIMTIFNDSYGSSSTDCDKTVLSNSKIGEKSKNVEVLEVNNTLVKLDMSGCSDEVIESTPSKDLLISENDSIDEPRTSFITTRKSSMATRKYSIKSREDNEAHQSFMIEDGSQNSKDDRKTLDTSHGIVLQPGKKWERSLSIYRRMTMITDHFDQSILEDEGMETKGRKYRQSVISTMEMQDLQGSLHNESINSRRSTFVSKPSRSTIRIVKDSSCSRLSICNSTVLDDLKGFWNEECDDTIVELSKLSIADQTHEVTVIDNFHDTSSRVATPRDYVLRRCNQTDPILFDECYPDTVLKNCHKIGEGVYGEVFLWRDRDGRARVLKIVPIAGCIKVNGESQKDFHEIISEIVIAMELSALRAPIAEIERHFDEGKDVDALDLHAIENATDVFNEVLAVRCVYGSYPSRLLDLWDLFDECKGSENDNPAILPIDQQYIVLELANAGQDLESYQFNNAEQAYALFLQVAYGLAVAEEAFQFEHRDLHWGNVLIAPTDQKFATFVIRGRAHRVARCGVSATIIDYSLSRVSLPLAGESAALYNDLASDDGLFDAVGDYQFQVYRLMRDKLGNDWKNFEPYTNILWLHYTVDKMITALRYKRTNTKIHKHYIDKLKGIKGRLLDYGSAALFVLTDNEI